MPEGINPYSVEEILELLKDFPTKIKQAQIDAAREIANGSQHPPDPREAGLQEHREFIGGARTTSFPQELRSADPYSSTGSRTPYPRPLGEKANPYSLPPGRGTGPLTPTQQEESEKLRQAQKEEWRAISKETEANQKLADANSEVEKARQEQLNDIKKSKVGQYEVPRGMYSPEKLLAEINRQEGTGQAQRSVEEIEREGRRRQAHKRYGPEEGEAVFQQREEERRIAENKKEARRAHAVEMALNKERETVAKERKESLPNMLSELRDVQKAQLEYYRGGGHYEDVAAAGYRSKARGLERRIGQKYAELPSEDQAKLRPSMATIEKNRDAIEKEEEAHRKLAAELKSGDTALKGFVRSLSYGNVIGAATHLGEMVGPLGMALTAGGLGAYNFWQQQNRMAMQGQAVLNPILTQEVSNQRTLNQMRVAREMGISDLQRERSSREQLQRQANLSYEDDPGRGAWFNIFSRQGLQTRGVQLQAGLTALWTSLSRGSFREGEQAGERVVSEYYRRAIRGRGETVREPRRDIAPLPGLESRIIGGPGRGSGILEYMNQLQTSALMTSTSERDITREQLAEQQRANSLLENIRDRLSTNFEGR